MAYRKDGQKAHSWRRWLLKNEAALERCGLPEFILEDELSWLYFLEHGYYGDRWDSNQFRLEDLSKTQLQELYAFLNAELSAGDKLSCVVLRVLPSLLEKNP